MGFLRSLRDVKKSSPYGTNLKEGSREFTPSQDLHLYGYVPVLLTFKNVHTTQKVFMRKFRYTVCIEKSE